MSAGRRTIPRHLPIDRARLGIWSAFALALIAAPLAFDSGASLSLLSQMGTAIIFGLSYNMLLGQGGMLSFGHAVYSGLGAFAAVRVLNLAGAGALWMPVPLVPLAGGLAGMAFGILSGYVMTRKSGTTFAMITLGIAELVSACWLMFPEFFGGEGGIATNRVIGEPVLGISFGPQIEVYYLIAFWLFVSTAAMYAFTQTPLGRIVNAVRDNPERAEFIGYDARWTRYLTLVLSAFFAGISGGLSAINFEIVSAENVGAVRSGAVLLFTVIGGTGFFFGPMIGAATGVFLTVMLSAFTRAWQLYIGLFFMAIVLWAPGGMASIVMANLRIARAGRYGRIRPPLWRLCLAAAAALAGVAVAIEMLYHLSLDAAGGSAMMLFGVMTDAASPAPWIVALVLTCAGALGAARVYPRFRAAWEDAHAEIEQQLREERA
jgi:branched-chain amino acid transport system permease protein